MSEVQYPASSGQDCPAASWPIISFVLRKYLKGHPMTPETFATRVFVVHGRKEIEPDRERIVFYENPRDPEVTAALRDASKRLNRRKLRREERWLRYDVESPPEGDI